MYTSHPCISTLSLHAALPISIGRRHHDRLVEPLRLPSVLHEVDGERIQQPLVRRRSAHLAEVIRSGDDARAEMTDRKSTRLNSSHTVNSYACFCFKKIYADK